jgi:hypothetical protein
MILADSKPKSKDKTREERGKREGRERESRGNKKFAGCSFDLLLSLFPVFPFSSLSLPSAFPFIFPFFESRQRML